ncbi:MAG TPA: DUF4440 domain-containing protein [Steroidobacteraceae bacterium]|nr:DUF4440 domain-containing protein [Steroidobacteraceae bacterium]
MTPGIPSLDQVKAELVAREPVFHRPEFGSTRAEFEAMMDEDFFEVGASGKKYSRDFVLEALQLRDHSAAEHLLVTDFACRAVAADVYLATYQLEQVHGRHSRRSSLWRRSAQGWKILYHQGTLCE